MDANNKVSQAVEPRRDDDVVIIIQPKEPSENQLPAAAAGAPVAGAVANGGSPSPPPGREVGTYRLESIPEWVRAVNSEAYLPRYISIGPIHRPKDGNDPLRCTALKNDYLLRLTQLNEDEYGLRRLDKEACLNALKAKECETRRLFFYSSFLLINLYFNFVLSLVYSSSFLS